jgi:Flp pilus assembly protein TadD
VLEATFAAQKQQYAEALKLVDRALARNADDGEALALKGKLHLRLGEKSSARQALGRACELLPADFEVNYNMGALVDEISPEEALPYLVRAYELRPPGPIADALRQKLLGLRFAAARIPVDLAKADLARGDVPGASEWVAKARTAEPENGEVRLLSGDLAARRGADAEAERELIEACRLLPQSLEARIALAQLYIKADDKEKAIAALEQLLAIARSQGTGAIEEDLLRRKARELLETLRGK